VAARRTGSLLFAADSPRFGRKGDNPPLEELLPVTLLPRSLKDLPDLAVLILLDVSGSMFGDKLSLAKVTGLELLRSLKPGDRVGMLLFSDERRWLYDFQPDAGIQASPALGPLSAGGGTDLHPALAEGLARLAGQPIKAKHVVLITDGITRPADFQPLVEEARRKGISISAMGVGLDANRPLLERLALQTEGRYYPVESVEAVPSLLFQDRMSEARAIFGQGRIPVLAMSGEQVGWVGGMAQYTPIPTASVLFADKAGDPLLASREQGNRAVLLFASDLHGGYTGEFFASREAVGAFKDRLDALFARRPVQVRVVQTARGISVLVRSDDLVAPALLLSRAGAPPVTCPFRRMDPGGWVAEAVLPFQGIWNAAILERGGSLAAFRIGVSGGLGGVRSDSAAALAAFRPKRFRIVRLPSLWLGLFFAASLACTVCLRVKR
ncbi:MAG TPA: vWA domain-containing protein, partial [Holophaga sp.]|nr:vWA domain-containing protein [Holophaga sp.]